MSFLLSYILNFKKHTFSFCLYSCPGATLILFKRQDGKVILHTGDFRADSVMEEYNAFKNVKIHQLFLDTT